MTPEEIYEELSKIADELESLANAEWEYLYDHRQFKSEPFCDDTSDKAEAFSGAMQAVKTAMTFLEG